MGDDDLARDGQAEPAAARHRIGRLREALEHPLGEFGHHAGALIVDGDDDLAALLRDRNYHQTVGRRHANRVGQQVGQHLQQPVMIAIDDERLLAGGKLDLHGAFVREAAHAVERSPRGPDQVEGARARTASGPIRSCRYRADR